MGKEMILPRAVIRALVLAEAQGVRGDFPPMTSEQQQLAVDNMKLATHIADRYRRAFATGGRNREADLDAGKDEAEGVAFVALCLAAQSWDPNRGIPFGKYAPSRIDWALQNELKRLGKWDRWKKMISPGSIDRIATRLSNDFDYDAETGVPVGRTVPVTTFGFDKLTGVADTRESRLVVKPGQRVKARTLGQRPQVVEMKVTTVGPHNVVSGVVVSGVLEGRVVRARVVNESLTKE